MSRARPKYPSFRRHWEQFVRLPGPDGALVAPPLYPAQARMADAIDALDPATGRRRYRRFLFSTPKKAGKSEFAAGLAVWALTSDTMNGADREVIIVASDLSQSRDVIFQRCIRQIERHPVLAKQTRILQTEITFREEARDPKTGGKYNLTHTLRAVPQDIRGLHGLNPSCTVFDEFWVLDDFDLLEALAPSPARPSPIQYFTSYMGLRSQARRGVPWFDLVHAAREKSDPALYAEILSGPDAWREVPWLTQSWVDDMRRQFSTCMSKFQRLVCNEVAQSESALISTPELQDALVDVAEPEYGERGVAYAMALDLGLTHDWSALVLGHVDGLTGRVLPDVVRVWRGTPEQPVSLAAVEETVVTLARRFRLKRIVVDQWQAGYLVERLRARNVAGVQLVTVEQAKLDRLVTLLKHLFASRAIAIPRRELALIEQLEWLETEEAGTRNRRRDRLRFVPGGDEGAGARDDVVVALSLMAEVLEGEAGRATLPPMKSCYYHASTGRRVECYLWNKGMGYFPGRHAAACGECPGHVGLWRMWEEHLARGGEPLPGGIRQFLQERVRLNDFCLNQQHQNWLDRFDL